MTGAVAPPLSVGDRLQQPVEARRAAADRLEPRITQPAAVIERNDGETVAAPHQQLDRRGSSLRRRDRLLDQVLRIGLSTHRDDGRAVRSEEHTSELQSLMRISYAVFCLKKKKNHTHT